jgi:alkylhydroperoxidase/carboxymuconolactone decarboxylase family protein YurZ
MDANHATNFISTEPKKAGANQDEIREVLAVAQVVIAGNGARHLRRIMLYIRG